MVLRNRDTRPDRFPPKANLSSLLVYRYCFPFSGDLGGSVGFGGGGGGDGGFGGTNPFSNGSGGGGGGDGSFWGTNPSCTRLGFCVGLGVSSDIVSSLSGQILDSKRDKGYYPCNEAYYRSPIQQVGDRGRYVFLLLCRKLAFIVQIQNIALSS